MAQLKDLTVTGDARVIGTLYANIEGNTSTSDNTKLLKNYYSNRQTDANISHLVNGGVINFLATGSMTANKPPQDCHILHMFWDNNSGYDSQLAVGQNTNPHLYVRGQSAGTWSDWRTILDSSNYSTYALPKTGGTITGNISYNMHGSTRTPVQIYGGDANGQGLAIGAGGATIIGSGEAADNIKGQLAATTEELWLASDNSITFYTGCQDAANKKGVKLTQTRQFYPDVDDSGSLGIGDHRWSNVYAVRLVGNVSTGQVAGSWIKGKTDAAIKFNNLNAIDSTSAWYFYNMKSSGGHTIAFGGLGNNIGFYTFLSGRTNNGTDSEFICNTSTGNWSTNKKITASNGFVGSLNGNADTATKLKNVRKINGVNFDGSADITTANWGTARNIGIVNSDGTGTAVTVSVNGSGNVNLKLPATIKASLTGNADTATTIKAIDNRIIKPHNTSKGYISAYFATINGLTGDSAGGNYVDLLVLNNYKDYTGGKANALVFDKNMKRILHYQADPSATNWGAPDTIAYTSSNVASATKLQTARTIKINNTAKTFDGSSNLTWTLQDITGLVQTNFGVQLSNTTTDSGWSMINGTYNGFLLKSLRTQANAPEWIENNYGAGICFGGSDTKGILSVRYGGPGFKIAGGNGTKPVWWMRITGTSGKTYNLDSLGGNTTIVKNYTNDKLSPYITSISNNYTFVDGGINVIKTDNVLQIWGKIKIKRAAGGGNFTVNIKLPEFTNLDSSWVPDGFSSADYRMAKCGANLTETIAITTVFWRSLGLSVQYDGTPPYTGDIVCPFHMIIVKPTA